jgi:YfiH family protein
MKIMNSAFVQHNVGGVVFLTAANLPVRHAFTTRLGGASTGAFQSLNLGENRGDDPDCVRENYRRLGAATGIDTSHMVFSRQVHEHTVRIAAETDRRALYTPIDYTADGLVTNLRGLPLIIFTADCVPVLLCDPVNGVIGAVHCGWRSTVRDILGEAVGEMCTLGANPAEIRAAIGPAIGACCFETGPEVPEAISTLLGGGTAGLVSPRPGVPGKFLVDLRGANARRLTQLDLMPEHIAVSGECTMCSHEKYWSHRHTKGVRGTQAALIVL